MQLRPYQIEALDAISAAEARGVRKPDFIGDFDRLVMAEVTAKCYTESSRAEEVLAYFPALRNNRKVSSAMTCNQSISPLNLRQSGIYLITCLVNGKRYVGQSQNIQSRWNDYLRKDRNPHSAIGRAFRKYGRDNFSFDVIEFAPVEMLDELETFYISIANSITPNGYNVAPIGGSNRGVRYGEEVTKPLSQRMKLLWSDAEFRSKRVARHNSEEVRNTISQRTKEACASPLAKARRAAATKQRMALPEVKAKHSMLQKQAWRNPKIRAKRIAGLINTSKKGNRKEVSQFTKDGVYLATFRSNWDAERITGISNKSISLAASGKRKTAGGFKWEYTKNDAA